ncbi:MAG TPA: hypothetical protein VMJ32_11030 [Pirellulales bacterium]|nr:hypothetical protein [Pirellulales bacterium]
MPSNALSPTAATPRWLVAVVGLFATVSITLALARIAVWLQSAHFAAIGVFPALFGAALGSALVAVSHWLRFRSRLAVVWAAIVAATLMAAAEHGLFYLDYRRDFAAKLQTDPNAQLAAALVPDQFQPATFYRFMAAEAPAKWLLWTLDALAMITVAAIVAWFLARSRSLTTARLSSPMSDH